MSLSWKHVIIDSLLNIQHSICPTCNTPIIPGQSADIDHIVLIKNGGLSILSNLRLLHTECHRKRNHNNVITDKIPNRILPILPGKDIEQNSKETRSVIINALSVSKNKIEKEILKKLLEEYDITKDFKKTCEKINITCRQARYLMYKHGLKRKVNKKCLSSVFIS